MCGAASRSAYSSFSITITATWAGGPPGSAARWRAPVELRQLAGAAAAGQRGEDRAGEAARAADIDRQSAAVRTAPVSYVALSAGLRERFAAPGTIWVTAAHPDRRPRDGGAQMTSQRKGDRRRRRVHGGRRRLQASPARPRLRHRTRRRPPGTPAALPPPRPGFRERGGLRPGDGPPCTRTRWSSTAPARTSSPPPIDNGTVAGGHRRPAADHRGHRQGELQDRDADDPRRSDRAPQLQARHAGRAAGAATTSTSSSRATARWCSPATAPPARLPGRRPGGPASALRGRRGPRGSWPPPARGAAATTTTTTTSSTTTLTAVTRVASAAMSSPRLWSWHLSPFAAKVRVACAEKGVELELVEIDPRHRPARLRELNPTGRVPVLEIDGRGIRESTAICEWLEETHPDPPLWPTEPAARGPRPADCCA